MCSIAILGLTLRLKGKKVIPDSGEVNINELPPGGCRRYDTLECLSDVPYRGRKEKAYWKYTDTITLTENMVDDIRCKLYSKCKSPDIGWWSTRAIYRKGKDYFNSLRLGMASNKAEVGLFTCHIEGDDKTPVSVNIVKGESKDKIYFH